MHIFDYTLDSILSFAIPTPTLVAFTFTSQNHLPLETRIVLKNEAHTLTKEERSTFEDVQGRQIDYSPTVITSTLNVSNSDKAIDTSSDVFCLYKGETPSAQNCIQLQLSLIHI